MCKFYRRAAAVLVLLAGSAFSAERTAQPHPGAVPGINPFSPPAASLRGGDRSSDNARQRSGSWDLKGIMLAGPASQIDLDGRLLGLGEEIYGYRLVAVEPRRAVLVKDGVREVVSFDEFVQEAGDG